MFVGISPTSRDEGSPPIVHPTMRTTLPNLHVLAGTLAAAMLAAPFAALWAQSPRPCPPVDGPVLLPCQVDRLPEPLSANAIPSPRAPTSAMATSISRISAGGWAVLRADGRPLVKGRLVGRVMAGGPSGCGGCCASLYASSSLARNGSGIGVGRWAALSTITATAS